jgi:hypothetical protein
VNIIALTNLPNVTIDLALLEQNQSNTEKGDHVSAAYSTKADLKYLSKPVLLETIVPSSVLVINDSSNVTITNSKLNSNAVTNGKGVLTISAYATLVFHTND